MFGIVIILRVERRDSNVTPIRARLRTGMTYSRKRCVTPPAIPLSWIMPTVKRTEVFQYRIFQREFLIEM